jgi:hypothetical protein
MGRSLQALGLLLMGSALVWGALLSSGSLVLVALANPCVPFGQGVQVISSQKVQNGTTAPASTPTPNTLIQAGVVMTAPPAAQVPIAVPSGHSAKLPTTIPVFGASEDLKLATPSPTPTGALTPAPPPVVTVATPSLPPCPRGRRIFGYGPILFSGTGSVDVGAHSSSSSASGQTSLTQSADQYSAGMQLEASRRTDQSALTVSDGVGEFNGTASVQGLDVAYNTAKYSLNYGLVQGSSDTQLSSGSFDQGLTLGVPKGRSEFDFILARTAGVNGETFRVGAVRHSTTYPNGSLLSETFFDAFGEQGGNSRTLDTAYSRFSANNSLRLEAAVTNSRDIATVPNATLIAYGLTDNLNGNKTSTTLSYTSIPYGYVALGQVQYGQNQFQFTNRRPFIGKGTLTFSLNDLSENDSGVINKTISSVISVSEPIGKTINSQWLFNDSTTSTMGEYSRQLQYGLNVSELVFKTSVQETISEVAQTGNVGGNSNEALFGLNASRQLLGGFVAMQYQLDHVTGSGSSLPSASNENPLGGTTTTPANAFSEGANSTQSDLLVSYERNVGAKAQISLSEEKQVSNELASGGTITNQFISTVGLTRRLSPLVALRMTYSRSKQTGPSAGSTGYFNVDIVGPLAIGTAARYNGRPNPNLPATIQGRVYLVSGASAYGMLGSRGFSNVLVTLDGGLTERTDATGAFQFSFIKPGPHIVSIATGTLPAGTVADTASQSLTIQGGQIATVDFSAGVFAAVGGTVTTTVAGKTVPVAGVLITVDDKYRGYTGVDGVYEVGHLPNGSHKVAVDDNSLPANLSVSGSQTEQVTVATGRVTDVDWKLLGLGSITGQVLQASNGGFGDLEPASNVYVVAEPGEHASITGMDGSFIIDNLPPGSYTLSLDQDTLPENQGVIQGPDGSVDVTGGDSVQGITFKLGVAAKAVVMGFGGNGSARVDASFEPDHAPPNGLTTLIVTTDLAHPASVTAQSDLFGNIALRYEKARRAWVALLAIPPSAGGDYPTHVDVTGSKNGGADTVLTVSNLVPLIAARGTPANPKPGEPVRVIARILAAHVAAGDLVTMEDGETFKLPPPRGTIYAFTIHVKHALPYRGLVFAKNGDRYPFVIRP